MAALIYLDTHVVVWLYAGRADLFPEPTLTALEATSPRISPIVLLELEYLREVGRITVGGGEIASQLTGQIGLHVCDLPFSAAVSQALIQTWTRDPFDRLIVGHAAAAGAALLTKDRTIHAHYRLAEWD